MIVVKLMGGMGNQMFQFAFALRYMIKGLKVKFDISYYDANNCHGGYCLEKAFNNLEIPKATKYDIFHFIEKIKNESGEFVYQLKANRFIVNEEKEQEFLYNTTLNNMDDTFFCGYWQNEGYFKNNTEVLKAYFRFKPISQNDIINKKILQQIILTNSVSIHIRRGDYLQSTVHITLSLVYYQDAMRKIKTKIKDPRFFVFSDDMEWAKQNIISDDVCFIEGNQKDKSHIDMLLMSMCKHNIIANSTFSWWAGWLNNNPQKVIIMPETWFNTAQDIEGLLIKNQIKL